MKAGKMSNFCTEHSVSWGGAEFRADIDEIPLNIASLYYSQFLP